MCTSLPFVPGAPSRAGAHPTSWIQIIQRPQELSVPALWALHIWGLGMKLLSQRGSSGHPLGFLGAARSSDLKAGATLSSIPPTTAVDIVSHSFTRYQPHSIAYILQVHELTCVLHQYFSSLERLRLAEDGRISSRPPSRPSHPSNDNSTTIQASDTFTVVTHSFIQTGHIFSARKLRRRRNSAADINSNTIAWFGSLSPAVQKKLFSKEECSFFSQESHTVILDAADETLYRRSWHPNQFAAFEDCTSEDDDTIVDSEEPKDEDEERVDSAIDMGDYSLDGFRWLEDDGDLDLKLDDYHQAIAETSRRTISTSEHPKCASHRNLSLTSLSIRHGRTSTSSNRPVIEVPHTPALPVIIPHSRSSSFSVKHLRSQASVSSIDPRATHYQDPAARLKLRLYLASPQKFDEAIEFGFPSVQGRNQQTLIRPMTSPQPRPEINRTFFHDDTPELSGDDDDEPEEPDTLLDPRTPEDAFFQMNRSRKGSIDGFAKARPFSMRKTTETYARGLPSDREMTLHMTLTRPDLRSPEEGTPQRNDPKVNKTPLEKAELPSEASPLSIWDSLPAEESKMKRFLRKLKLK